MITAQDLVRREVHYCVSYLVHTLAGAYGDQHIPAMAELAEQAFELSTPIDDWEDAATGQGADFYQHELGSWYCYHPSMEIEGPNLSPYGPHYSREDAARDYCESEGIEPYPREVYEHWIVSDWLADKLAEKGEKVDKDFAGMTVWARTTTGQAIYTDSVIEEILADLNKAD